MDIRIRTKRTNVNWIQILQSKVFGHIMGCPNYVSNFSLYTDLNISFVSTLLRQISFQTPGSLQSWHRWLSLFISSTEIHEDDCMIYYKTTGASIVWLKNLVRLGLKVSEPKDGDEKD